MARASLRWSRGPGQWLRALLSQLATRRAARLLVDDDWYFSTNPTARATGLSAYAHYRRFGARDNLDPSRWLHRGWYLSTYPDVAIAGADPLLHYVNSGAGEGRNPSTLFDTAYYIKANPDVAASGLNPLIHFVLYGHREGRRPLPSDNDERPVLDIALPRRASSTESRPTDIADSVIFAVPSADQMNVPSKVVGRLAPIWRYAEEVGKPLVSLPAPDIPASPAPFDVAPYLVELEDVAMIAGTASLLTRTNQVLNDELAYVNKHFQSPAPKSTSTELLGAGQVAIGFVSEVTPTIERAIHLTKEYEQNYFHWVTENLTRIWAIEQLGVDPSVPVLVCDDLDPRLYEALDAVVAPQRPILRLKRDRAYRVKQLIYAADLARLVDMYNEPPGPHTSYLPRLTLKTMARQIKARLGVTDHLPAHKLILIRREARRSLLNQSELASRLVPDGFVPTLIDSLTFAGQVELMAATKAIVAPTGAALTNMLWCQPGTRVVVMGSDHPFANRTFWNTIAAISELDIHFAQGPRSGDVTGRFSVHDNYRVDPDQVKRLAVPRDDQ